MPGVKLGSRSPTWALALLDLLRSAALPGISNGDGRLRRSCNLGFAGGPFALGSLADAVGYPIVFAVAGGFAFAALALFRMSPESRAPVAAAVRSPTPGPAGRR